MTDKVSQLGFAAKEDREILLCTSDIQKDGPRGSSDGE